MSWRVSGEARELNPPPGGADATVWAWQIERDSDSETRTVLVSVTGTAMTASDVSFRLDEARRTKGETEIGRITDWDEPPTSISFHSASEKPAIEGGAPGREVRELMLIAEWFDERGISLVFTARGVGHGANVSQWTHAANLVDRENDELVHRAEAPTRLEAAQLAMANWDTGGRSSKSVLIDAEPATAEAAAPAPAVVRPEERARLKRLGIHLIWSAPQEGDPTSGWMLEAYDDDANLIDIAVQLNAEDALLTISESITPEQEAEDEGDDDGERDNDDKDAK